MKISIDTKEDSPDEIRKLIRMLLALVGESSSYAEKAPPSTDEGLFDMFGDPSASIAEQQQLGKDSGSGGMDINDFIDNADESSQQKTGTGEDDDFKVVPY